MSHIFFYFIYIHKKKIWFSLNLHVLGYSEQDFTIFCKFSSVLVFVYDTNVSHICGRASAKTYKQNVIGFYVELHLTRFSTDQFLSHLSQQATLLLFFSKIILIGRPWLLVHKIARNFKYRVFTIRKNSGIIYVHGFLGSAARSENINIYLLLFNVCSRITFFKMLSYFIEYNLNL